MEKPKRNEERRSWRTCWCDRRFAVQHASIGLLVVFLFLTILAIAYAADTSGEESLGEHSTAIIKTMAYIIIALFSGLVGIGVWNALDMKSTMRANHEELKLEFKKYVRIQVHNAICKTQIQPEGD
jgi:hypothetical protein